MEKICWLLQSTMGRKISRKVIFQIYNEIWWCAYYFKENVIHKTIMWQWKNHTNGSLEFMKDKSNILIYNITIYNVQKYKIGKHNDHDFINSRKSNQFYFMNFGIMEEKKKEEFEWCSAWCGGCLEFIIEVLTLCAVLKILFLM